MEISIKTNVKKLTKSVIGFADQIPFVTAQALTKTAVDARKGTQARLRKDLDRPTRFTQNAPRYKAANKRNLTASVFIPPTQYDYLKYTIEGGVRKPKRKAIAIGVNVKRNQYGNVSRKATRTALSKPNTFSGVVKGIDGIWQRYKGSKRIKLLFAYYPLTEYSGNQFKYFIGVRDVVAKQFDKHFAQSFKRAIQTARI